MKQFKVNESVLLEPIKNMSTSQEFKQMAEANGFKTLQDILDSSIDDLHDLPQSDYRMLKEFSDILKRSGLQYLLND